MDVENNSEKFVTANEKDAVIFPETVHPPPNSMP